MTGLSGSRYRTSKIRYMISRQCTGQEGSRYKTRRGPATGQAKQGTGSAGNEQDRKGHSTGQAGSSYRTGKTRYRISRKYAG